MKKFGEPFTKSEPINTNKFEVGDNVKVVKPFYAVYNQYNVGDTFVITDYIGNGEYKVKTNNNRYIAVNEENIEKV